MKRLLQSLFLLFAFAMNANAQNRTITGTVTGKDDGLPIPGVSVRVSGTANGTSTGAGGKFTINVGARATALEFSSIGFLPSTEKISDSNVINVQLVTSAKGLSEVVVTGYGTQKRSTTTGSIGQVGGREVEDKPYTSVDQALQGRVAGLQSVGGSGQPGGLQQIRIRGIGSISAGSDPLYVVDGVPINAGNLSRFSTTANAIAGINPNDIESINVLKDASAAAIYGARAANGVIVITTKSGHAGKTTIRVDAEYGWVKPSQLRDPQKPLNTDQYRELTAEGLLNYSKNITDPTSPYYGFTPDMINQYVDDNFGTGSGVSTDWIKEVTRTGRQQQYNVSADGGDQKTQFHIGVGYFKQQGTVIASDFNRYSTSFSVRHKANEKLSFGANFTLGETGVNSPSNGGAYSNPVASAYFLPPYLSPYNADGTLNLDQSQFSSNYNPIATAQMNKASNHQFKGIGSLNGEYKILPNFKFTSKIGVDVSTLEEDNYWNPDYGDGQGYNGLSSRYYTRYFNWVATNLLEYHFDLHNENTWVANIKAGYEAQKSQYYDVSVTTTGLPSNTNVNVPSAGSSPLEALGTNSDYSFASILALGDISYKGKYVLSGSFRRDGSSRFGANNRYGDFGSIGASWNMQEEDFIKKLSWISLLKLRGSYGTVGNANILTNGVIDNYAARQLYSYGYNYLGSGGTTLTNVGNPALTWEANTTSDVGLDLSVFKDRLSFTFDWYNRQSNNLLLAQPLSPTSGSTSFNNNVGSMRNRGYEVALSGTPLIIGDFKWNAGFNISHNTNKILSLVNDKDQVDGAFIRRVGYDFQSFYLRQWAGVDPATGSALWYTDETRSATTTSYSAAKQVLSKSASPKYFGSFTSDFSYKGFGLSGLLYYNFGNYIQDTWARYFQSDGYDPSDNRVASQLDRWQKPGDITNVPKYVYNNGSSSSSASSRFLYKGDYIRLREVTLSYNFQPSVLQKLKIASLKVYARGTNLFTWVKDDNLPYDPETYITGQTNLDVYMPKTYTIGLNVGF
jgi:TonB-linked SusC/RagA family outer membrane protein